MARNKLFNNNIGLDSGFRQNDVFFVFVSIPKRIVFML